MIHHAEELIANCTTVAGPASRPAAASVAPDTATLLDCPT
jgi:hypothetical protein